MKKIQEPKRLREKRNLKSILSGDLSPNKSSRAGGESSSP